MRDPSLPKFSSSFITIMVLATVAWGTSAAWAQRGDANVLAAKAAIAYEDKQYDEALTLLNKAIALVPSARAKPFLQRLGLPRAKKTAGGNCTKWVSTLFHRLLHIA